VILTGVIKKQGMSIDIFLGDSYRGDMSVAGWSQGPSSLFFLFDTFVAFLLNRNLFIKISGIVYKVSSLKR